MGKLNKINVPSNMQNKRFTLILYKRILKTGSLQTLGIVNYWRYALYGWLTKQKNDKHNNFFYVCTSDLK